MRFFLSFPIVLVALVAGVASQDIELHNDIVERDLLESFEDGVLGTPFHWPSPDTKLTFDLLQLPATSCPPRNLISSSDENVAIAVQAKEPTALETRGAKLAGIAAILCLGLAADVAPAARKLGAHSRV